MVYGAVSLFSIMMIVFVLRVARDSELKTLKSKVEDLSGRLSEADSAISQAETRLKQELKSKEELLNEKHSVADELDDSLRRVQALSVQLRETQEHLIARDKQLKTLGSEATDVTRRPTDVFRRSSDAALHATVDSLNSRTRILETQLKERDHLLEKQRSELVAFKSKVTALTGKLSDETSAKERVEGLQREELRKAHETVAAKDLAIKEMEDSLARTTHALEAQLSEKQKLLISRDGELEVLRSELQELTGQMAVMGSAKEQVEGLQREELRKAHETVAAKDLAIKEMEDSLARTTHALEAQLSEKTQLLSNRDLELMSLTSQLNVVAGQVAELESENKQLENALQEEPSAKNEAEGSSRIAIKELDENIRTKVRELESQLSAKQQLLNSRDGELEVLRSELNGVTGQLTDMGSAKEQAERVLRETLKQKPALLPPPDATLIEGIEWVLGERINALETQLNNKDELLKSRDRQIESLNEEVREKRILFATEERKVWQSIEAQNLWKGRLAKLGFRF